jgi:hypothetical protein
MHARSLLIGALVALLTTWHSSILANSGDVTIKINGGNVAHIGELNKLELWITNDVPLGSILLPLRTDWLVSYRWTKPYGNKPIGVYRVQEHGDALTVSEYAFNFRDNNDGVSPDSMVLGIVGFSPALPVHLTSTKLYDLEFYVEPWQAEAPGGMCIDNILYFPDQEWAFTDSSGLGPDFAPSYQGQPNTDIHTPDAPPVCFDIVQRPFVKGDADLSGAVDISDAVYLVRYIFNGGSMPVPYQAGDANCDLTVDISDVVYLIAFIFAAGPAPC